MHVNESAENYLECILMLTQKQGTVRSIDVARELGFSKPSVSVAMKNLRENGSITVDTNGSITLTDKGLETAERTYERHKLLRSWLISLGVAEETAERDACMLEHDLSIESFEAIKRAISK